MKIQHHFKTGPVFWAGANKAFGFTYAVWQVNIFFEVAYLGGLRIRAKYTLPPFFSLNDFIWTLCLVFFGYGWFLEGIAWVSLFFTFFHPPVVVSGSLALQGVYIQIVLFVAWIMFFHNFLFAYVTLSLQACDSHYLWFDDVIIYMTTFLWDTRSWGGVRIL